MSNNENIALDVFLEVSLESPIGQLRAIPVSLENGKRAFLAVYCADFDNDPYIEMFFFPSDTLKMTLFTEEGEILWHRDLGKGVVRGIWFCPVFVFDLDGDGVDEIWFVNNLNTDHPLGLSGYHLERIDARNGKTTGQWKWRYEIGKENLSHTFRNFILGGYVKDEPILVTAHGTYGNMFLEAFNPDMSQRWELLIKDDEPGARGSHMCAISDLDGNGVQEVLWGERCIELDGGKELFCADKDNYRGHSDIVLPFRDVSNDGWFIYTCREGDHGASPRVLAFDDKGDRIWGHVDEGHMDMGWVARLGDNYRHVAMAIRIGHKTCGSDGRFHYERDEFVFDAITGENYALPFEVYGTLPVDLNGDGYHELVKGVPGHDGTVMDRFGNEFGRIGGTVAAISKLIDHPGEQIFAFYPDGRIRIWYDKNAKDCPEALKRYSDPCYKVNQKLTGVGYNIISMCGS